MPSWSLTGPSGESWRFRVSGRCTVSSPGQGGDSGRSAGHAGQAVDNVADVALDPAEQTAQAHHPAAVTLGYAESPSEQRK